MKSENYALCALIKIHRNKKELSQSQLSKGICAVSYLSKLENGEIEPNEDTLSLLLDRLNIRYYRLSSFSEQEINCFERYFKRVFDYDVPSAKQVFLEIKKNIKKYLYSPLIVNVLLMELHYLTLPGKKLTKRVHDLQCQLDSVSSLLRDKQRVFYFYIMSVLADSLEKQKQYINKAISIAPYAMLYKDLVIKHMGSFHYMDALEAAQKSLDCSVEEGNFRGIVFANNIFGEVYSALREYDRAEAYYDRIIKLLNTSKTNDMYIFSFMFYSYVNKASLAYFKNELEMMLKYSTLAMKYEETQKGKVNGIFHYLLMSEYFEHKDYDKAKSMVETAKQKLQRSITADVSVEAGLVDLFDMKYSVKGVYDKQEYLKKLKELRKIIIRNGRYHFIHFVNRKLIEFYVENKKYKDAFNIHENASNNKY